MEDEMPRIPRLINEGEATVYHVMSRTALDGFPLGDIEKDYLLAIIKKFAGLYFIDVLGFALDDSIRLTIGWSGFNSSKSHKLPYKSSNTETVPYSCF